MGKLTVIAVVADPKSTFTPDRFSADDFGEVVTRYQMEMRCGSRQITVRFAVAVKQLGRGEEHVSAWPEDTREFMSFLMQLGGNPLRSPVRWARVLSSVVASVHREIEWVFPDEYTTQAEPGWED